MSDATATTVGGTSMDRYWLQPDPTPGVVAQARYGISIPARDLEGSHGVDDRVVNEVCDNCGSPLVVVRSRAGRFCTSECAEAFELS